MPALTKEAPDAPAAPREVSKEDLYAILDQWAAERQQQAAPPRPAHSLTDEELVQRWRDLREVDDIMAAEEREELDEEHRKRHQRKHREDAATGRAVMVVAALVQQELIAYTPRETMSEQNFSTAVRIVAAALANMDAEPGEWPTLPFEW